ncbi:MAG TPA: AP2/ERF family transcription factor [Nitrososphaera sp.]|jgi:hypothetical protein
MKEIPLTRGEVALVDDEDYDWLMQWKWHYTSNGYAARRDGKYGPIILMHRQILGLEPGDKTQSDHIDRDKVNNQRFNLRIASNRQNSMNTSTRKILFRSSEYKGVTQYRDGRWMARIMVNYQQIFLGYFNTEEEAARAYDEAAIRYFGEYAYLNFPSEHGR